MSTSETPSVQSGWGERLAAARIAAGHTQPSLAALLGVAIRTVTRWEAFGRTEDGRQPNAVDQVRLARALNTGVTDLFPRSDDEAELVVLAGRLGSGCS